MQGLLAAHGGAGAAGEQAEPVVQAVDDLARRERPHARRGQLDGQRNTVQTTADLRHRHRLRRRSEVGPHPAGAVGEQLDRFVGQRQRRHPPSDLAGHTEGSRLVATRTSGSTEQRHGHAATASSRCSQLSNTISSGRSATTQQRVRRRASRLVGQSQRDAHRGRDRSGSAIGARSTNHTLSANRPPSRRRSVHASRVLPTPPAPVRVTNRCSASSCRTWVISAARPTNSSVRRKPWAATVFGRRSGGTRCAGRDGTAGRLAPAAADRGGDGRPDRSARRPGAGRLPGARCPGQHGLAAMSQIPQPGGPVDGGPISFLSSRSRISPVCTPMRSRSGANGARCRARAQATASRARENATTKLSPSPCSIGRTPSWAAVIRPGSDRAGDGYRRLLGPGLPQPVEPSTSASSNVTVPVGNSVSPARSSSAAPPPLGDQSGSC